jgi:hypothetical protein
LNIEPFALSVVQEKAPRGVGTAVANGQSRLSGFLFLSAIPLLFSA